MIGIGTDTVRTFSQVNTIKLRMGFVIQKSYERKRADIDRFSMSAGQKHLFAEVVGGGCDRFVTEAVAITFDCDVTCKRVETVRPPEASTGIIIEGQCLFW